MPVTFLAYSRRSYISDTAFAAPGDGCGKALNINSLRNGQLTAASPARLYLPCPMPHGHIAAFRGVPFETTCS